MMRCAMALNTGKTFYRWRGAVRVGDTHHGGARFLDNYSGRGSDHCRIVVESTRTLVAQSAGPTNDAGQVHGPGGHPR